MKLTVDINEQKQIVDGMCLMGGDLLMLKMDNLISQDSYDLLMKRLKALDEQYQSTVWKPLIRSVVNKGQVHKPKNTNK